jgi:hypothetical protein
MKTLEAFLKATEGKVVRNIKYDYEIECVEGKYLKGKNKYFDFNFMNLDDEWEVVEKKKLYNIRVYDSTEALIESFIDEIEESKVKDYIHKVFKLHFDSEIEKTIIYSNSCPEGCPIPRYKGNVIAQLIKTNNN